MILEKKDVQFLTVSEVSVSPQVVLHLKGLAMHSSMGISRVDQIVENNNYVILVHLALIRGGMSGTMDFDVVVPSGIDTVLFGKNREIVWKRNP